MRSLRIGTTAVGLEHRPFVIAELSGNHGGSLERALRIVHAAADAGASAVKLQTFTPDSMTLDLDRPDFTITEPSSLWYGRRLYDLYAEAATPWEWHRTILDHAAELGLVAFSSPFDVEAVRFLESLDVPCYKIASLENNDNRLIEAVARTGKPVIISTGASTLEEVDEAVEVARGAGCRELILLKCTSGYPTPPQDANLLAVPMMRARYGCEIGLSDHSAGIGVAVAAVALGASVVEKHVIDSRASGGVDAAFSLEPDELAALVTETGRAQQARGEAVLAPTSSEEGTRSRRRSLYVTANIRAGERFHDDNVRSVRPSRGLHPRHLEEVLGSTATTDLDAGTALRWDHIGRSS